MARANKIRTRRRTSKAQGKKKRRGGPRRQR